ncbi:DUF3105 domain-containing protein [Nonomuraea sp. NPDC050663]|uniref:DUF3105 domain-containing protein n=1 Tax=Nonomuraea sp. NPDC050663 TaxID=3364370 RepID=UPI0037A514B3
MTKEKAQQRRDQLAKMRAQQRAKDRRGAMLMWGAGGLVIVLLVGLVGFYLVRQSQLTNLDAAVSKKYEGSQHVWEAVKYEENPPIGGPHNNYWQQCDVYDKPIHNEHGVHSLEHGAVWITYRSDLPKAQVDKIKEIASTTGQQDFMLVSPVQDLPSPIVASSWGHQLKFESLEEERLAAFIKKFQNGPDTPEPGATCGGQYAVTTTADQAPLPPQPQPEATTSPSAQPSAQPSAEASASPSPSESR